MANNNPATLIGHDGNYRLAEGITPVQWLAMLPPILEKLPPDERQNLFLCVLRIFDAHDESGIAECVADEYEISLK